MLFYMVIELILWGIALIALIIGTITDIKYREVPDWINYCLIFSGIGIRIIYSLILFSIFPFLSGIAGLAVCAAIAYAMFYAGQWGGGDAKMLMGLGALIGLPVSFIFPYVSFSPFPLIILFLINVLLIGAIYGIIYSIVLAFINRKDFLNNFKKRLFDKKMILIQKILMISSVLLIIVCLIFLRDTTLLKLLLMLLILTYLSFYLLIFTKAVELSAMFKLVNPEKLTEGDWIAKDYIISGKKICGPKDLGISKKQIKQLIAFKKKGKIDKIKIKQGIPFVPSFLLAFILSLSFGAWWISIFL